MTVSVVLFPDSNLFLQFRDLPELPWNELISGADEVNLLICRTVQSEIDSFKGDGRERRADRARKVSSKFRDIILQGTQLVLREHKPRLTLNFSPRVRSTFLYPNTFDMSFKDDRIVAEIWAYKSETGQNAALLTADTGPMMTARDHMLGFHILPDSWRLPKEADERDKQIRDLAKQLADLRNLSPSISVDATVGGEQVPTPTTIKIFEFNALNDVTIEKFIDRLQERFPMKTDFSTGSNPAPQTQPDNIHSLPLHFVAAMGGPKIWTAPSQIMVEKYKLDYQTWLKSVRLYLNDVHIYLSMPHRKVIISFSVDNIGTVPAENILVEIESVGGLLLAELAKDSEDKEPSRHLPYPPQSLEWTMTGPANFITNKYLALTQAQGNKVEMPSSFSQHMHPSTQDDHSFYRYDKNAKDSSTHLKFRCTEFRHGSGAITFDLRITVPFNSSCASGAIQVKVSARNIPSRIQHTFPVNVVSEDLQTEKQVESMIESFSNDFI